LFIFGNKVDPTILGSNPNIPSNAVWQDNLAAEFDFKQIYSSIINQWLSVGENRSEDVLFNSFEQLPIIGSQYIDSDGDGVSDVQDLCNTTAAGAIVDVNGCEIFTLPSENYTIQTNGVSCAGSDNGIINISAANTNYIYRVSVSGNASTHVLNTENQHQVKIDGLGIGTYTLNIRVEGESNYLQTFEIGITEPASFSAKTSVNQKGKSLKVNVSGSALYLVELNGESKIYKEENFKVNLRSGFNTIKISTPQDCQGAHSEEIFISEQVEYYPNPVIDVLNLVIPGSDTNTQIKLFNRSGSLLMSLDRSIPFSRIVKINASSLTKGVYVATVKGATVDQSFKIQKR
jgi:hypothetical protein